MEEKAIGLATSPAELIAAIRRALADRDWLAEGRGKIRRQMLGPLDGRATERLAGVAVNLALNNRSDRKWV